MNSILLKKPLFLKDILATTGGVLKNSQNSTVNAEKFSKIATDTRADLDNALFIALKGENFDAHDFLKLAKEKGAVAVLIENFEKCPADLQAIVVENTRTALAQMAHFVRGKFDGKVFGITGSNGKTTTKEMLSAILKTAFGDDNVWATQGNLNNDIGVPLTLLQLGDESAAVVEMGMNHIGEIAQLAKIAEPNVALITNAGRAHLEFLKTTENVAREKGAILQFLKDDGIAILPKASEFFDLWKKMAGNRRVFSFALNDDSADFVAKTIQNGARFSLNIQNQNIDLQVLGLHNAQNACAAAAAAFAAGVPLNAIAEALNNFKAPKGRLCAVPCQIPNLEVIDDTYNANPESMRAAIQVLSTVNAKKILVLGDMGEVGEDVQKLHAEIGVFAREKGIDALFAIGKFSKLAVEKFGEDGKFFDSAESLAAAIKKAIKKEGAPSVVLVKGSRFMRMEKIVEILQCS